MSNHEQAQYNDRGGEILSSEPLQTMESTAQFGDQLGP